MMLIFVVVSLITQNDDKRYGQDPNDIGAIVDNLALSLFGNR
jgi:hypothetical protein